MAIPIPTECYISEATEPQRSSPQRKVAMIVGPVVGAVVLLFLIGLTTAFCCLKKRRRQATLSADHAAGIEPLNVYQMQTPVPVSQRNKSALIQQEVSKLMAKCNQDSELA